LRPLYTDCHRFVSNVDIRDYNNDGWTDTINGTTTTNVFNDSTDNWGMAGRLDMQQISLPSSFADQTLTSIELIDNGGPSTQRVVLDGVTVQTASVPEPSSIILLGIVAAGAMAYAWRWRLAVAA
jgi:PEP-CTERM motif